MEFAGCIRYNVFGIDQRKAVEMGLDLKDAALLDHVTSFYPAAQKVVHDGKEYGWISAQHVVDCLPILDMQPAQVRRRLKALCEKGLLESYTPRPNRGENRRAYYRATPLLVSMKYSGMQDGSDNKASAPKDSLPQQTVMNTVTPPMPEKPKPTKKRAKKDRPLMLGTFANVPFSEDELDQLKEKFPTDWQDRVDSMSEYMESKGKSYNSGLATICNWARNDAKKARAKLEGRGKGTTWRELTEGMSVHDRALYSFVHDITFTYEEDNEAADYIDRHYFELTDEYHKMRDGGSQAF